MTTIKTPDQRLRVFVSSTIHELAAERNAARRAIENLRLSPILFELGARPHPPRDLYRAYLDQSHIFVGIYWTSYGWVGPGMDISGLEDEYELAGDKPKLIYIKAPAPDREDRLAGLLERIRSDNVSYRQFRDPGELQYLIENDLALLLTERFQSVGEKPGGVDGEGSRAAFNLPAQLDRFIGREEEIDSLCMTLHQGAARLITLTGPGGIGKTRLAIEAASRCAKDFEHGVHFVPLGSLTQSEVVIPTITQSLNVQGSSAEPLVALIGYLRDRNMLLVLDNFEQVTFAAPEVGRIVEECARVTILVTSRAVLNVRAEHQFAVAPLDLPPEDVASDDAASYEAVQLFLERATANNPDFELNRRNAAAIMSICRRLDGLPLALELAAARIRLLQPEAILTRLDSSLQLLTSGSRDVPERHQTLRAAIDWSFGLLNDAEKKLFTRMGVFHGGCSLEGAEDVCNASHDLDLLDVMTSLLEKSLIKHEIHAGEPRFTMLRTVWEYADELLARIEDVAKIRREHAEFFLSLVAAAHGGLRSSGQTAWLARLETDHDNLRAAIRWCLENDAAEAAAEAGWTLWLFWWLDSHLAEARQLMDEVLEVGGISELARAKAGAVKGFMAFWQTDYAEGIPLLASALDVFRSHQETGGMALCQLPLGFAEAAIGANESARERFRQSIDNFKKSGDEWGVAISMNALCWTSTATDLERDDAIFEEALARAEALGTELDIGMALRNLGIHRGDQGRIAEAKEFLAQALQTLWRGYVRGGTSYTVDGIAELAAAEGAHAVATRLLAATDAVREASGAPIIPMFAPRFRRAVDGLREAMGQEAFEAEWATGRTLGLDGAAKIGLAWAQGVTSEAPEDEEVATPLS
jgi:predicted ATPase